MDTGMGFSWRHPEHFHDQLRSLCTPTFKGLSTDLVILHHHAPSLVRLHAITPVNDLHIGPLFTGLTVTKEPHPLIPELEQLTIELDPRTIFASCVGPLLTTVASRMKHLEAFACTLEHLTIVIPNAGVQGKNKIDSEQL